MKTQLTIDQLKLAQDLRVPMDIFGAGEWQNQVVVFSFNMPADRYRIRPGATFSAEIARKLSGAGVPIEWQNTDGSWRTAHPEICAWSSAFDYRVADDDSEAAIESEPKVAPQPAGHFIVVARGDRSAYAPATAPHVHMTRWDADTEALRLANEHGGTFVVFQAVSAFEKPHVSATQVHVI